MNEWTQHISRAKPETLLVYFFSESWDYWRIIRVNTRKENAAAGIRNLTCRQYIGQNKRLCNDLCDIANQSLKQSYKGNRPTHRYYPPNGKRPKRSDLSVITYNLISYLIPFQAAVQSVNEFLQRNTLCIY